MARSRLRFALHALLILSASGMLAGLAGCAKTPSGQDAVRRPPNMNGVHHLLGVAGPSRVAELSASPQLDLGGKTVIGPFNDKSNKMQAQTVVTLTGPARGPAGVLVFDLYLLGTWDDEGQSLADEWRMTRLSGDNAPQQVLSLKKFGDFPVEGRIKIGRHELDVTRKTMRVPLPPLDDKGLLKLELKGFLTGQATELWAIDGLRVEAK